MDAKIPHVEKKSVAMVARINANRYLMWENPQELEQSIRLPIGD